MNETPSATAIIAPIWRRKWLILLVGIVVAGATYLYYKHEPATYQSETKLYLNGGSEETASGEKAGAGRVNAATDAAQPEIISSVIVESVRRQLRKENNRIAKAAAKGKVKAKAAEKSQFITITTEAHLPRATALLANTVAQAYIARQHKQYERGILTALVIAHRQLIRIETPTVLPGSSKGKSSISSVQGNVIREAQLNSHINQLEAELGVQQIQQLSPARPTKALLLGPAPKKNALFGFVIGLLLASIAAFVLARLDRRLRLVSDIEAIFHAQILAVLPEVRRPIVDRDGHPEPSRVLIEPLRLLRTTLMLNRAPAGESQATPRSILLLSPDAGDGRSTIVADLALVQREAGERAAVVDADFRRPTLARILGLSEHAGLLEVLSGTLTLEEALQAVPAPAPEPLAGQPRGGGDVATALATRDSGAAVALPARAAAAVNPPALLGSQAMRDVLASLTADFDHVLLDAPSPLEFSDSIPLLSAVDGIVLVTRLGHTRERSAERLQQLLARTPSAPILGVVANGVSTREIERYGIAVGGRRRGLSARLIGR